MKRKKILVVNFYSFFPPVNGGQISIYGFYRNLARWFDVEVVDFTGSLYLSGTKEISDCLLETSLFRSKEIIKKEHDFYEEYLDSTMDSSIPCARYYSSVPAFVEGVGQAAENAELVITDHPYTFRVVKKACPDKIIWYRANNVEFDYKKSTYKNLASRDALVNEVYQIEKECCEHSDLILTVTEEDGRGFQSTYNVPGEKILYVPPGYEWETADFVLPSRRCRLTGDDGYKMTAFFLSSYSEPAVWGAKKIIDIAKELPYIEFIIAGSVMSGLKKIKPPENVKITGIIHNKEKDEILTSADVALNLVEDGSGINMKMLEYFAFGIPVISTPFGVRGLNVSDKHEVVLADQDEFRDAIVSFCNSDLKFKDSLADNARAYLVNNFTWRNIAKKVKNYIASNNIFLFDDHEFEISQNRKPVYSYCKPEGINDIQEKLDAKKVVWGAGSGGIACFNTLKTLGREVYGFIDSDPRKWNSEISGVRVFSPQYYRENFMNFLVIIASEYTDEICSQLLEFGVDKNNIMISVTGNLFCPHIN